MSNEFSRRPPTLERTIELQRIRNVLRRAKVPDATINEVIEEEEETQEGFTGYVRIVHCTASHTVVSVQGTYQFGGWGGEIILSFPPNEPRFLEQLIRAQNHRHMRVEIYATLKGGTRIVTGVNVYWDYGLPPLTNMPALEPAASPTQSL
jgi:hypothetical protein